MVFFLPATCDCKVNLTAVAEWQSETLVLPSQEDDEEDETKCLGPCTNSTTTSIDDLVHETEVIESPGWELP